MFTRFTSQVDRGSLDSNIENATKLAQREQSLSCLLLDAKIRYRLSPNIFAVVHSAFSYINALSIIAW